VGVTGADARRSRREQQIVQRQHRFQRDVAQGALEGYVLLRPDGSFTAEVVHVQWMDNHPAGPDTHAMVSFADGTNVEFAFDTQVVKARPTDATVVTPDDTAAAAPSGWGVTAAGWNDA
jgi:hypothetical protein